MMANTKNEVILFPNLARLWLMNPNLSSARYLLRNLSSFMSFRLIDASTKFFCLRSIIGSFRF